jgi:hypothetical protein
MIFREADSIEFGQALGDYRIPVTCVPEEPFLVGIRVAGHG